MFLQYFNTKIYLRKARQYILNDKVHCSITGLWLGYAITSVKILGRRRLF